MLLLRLWIKAREKLKELIMSITKVPTVGKAVASSKVKSKLKPKTVVDTITSVKPKLKLKVTHFRGTTT